MEKQEKEVPLVQVEMIENLNEDIDQSDTEAIEPQEVAKRAQTTQSPPQVPAPKRGYR